MAWIFRWFGRTVSVGRCFEPTAPNGYRSSKDQWVTIRTFNVGQWGMAWFRIHRRTTRLNDQ